MLLTAREVARLLDVTEKRVLHWIRKEGLPAAVIDDRHEINRVDLLEWATGQGIKVPPELFAGTPAEEALPSLADALAAGGIHGGVPGSDKLSVLRNVVELLPLPPRVDREFLLQVLMAREALGTTAIGDGIAIPHVRNPILLQAAAPSITLCFLREPIDFHALDGKPVHILFTLTSPTVKSHLHLLSRLAYALREPQLKEVLARTCDAGKILETVRFVEGRRPRSPGAAGNAV